MKIARIETFAIAPRWLFCRVETDDGLVGWGEPIVEGRMATTRTAVEELAELIVGRDPRRIEDLWQVMTKAAFYRGGAILASAVAGIDQALWDILGQSLGVPVHQLLGGHVRDRIRVYGWIGGDEPSAVADAARAQVEVGFTAVKMNASAAIAPQPSKAEIDAILGRAHAVRTAIGDDRDLAIDFHGRIGVAAARILVAELSDVAPLFVEEPILPELSHRIGDIVDATTIPIACGERAYSRAEFLPLLQNGVAVVQPDLSHAGGISEVRRIASMAETYGALLAPHCPLGPLSLAAGLQVSAATPNFLIQEQSIGIHYNRTAEMFDYLLDTEPLRITDGYIALPTRPGLGIDIDEAAVRAADGVSPAWHPPVWRHPDGGFAEW